MICQSPAHLGTCSLRRGTAPEDQIPSKDWHSVAFVLGVDVSQIPGDHSRGGLCGVI